MRKKDFINALLETKVIMAVRNIDSLERALCRDGKVIFVVYGNLASIEYGIKKAKKTDKFIFIHLDMIEGIALSNVAVEYLKTKYAGDFGIITTKNGIVKQCSDENIPVIKRVFALDSLSVDTIMEQREIARRADAVEIMPGFVPDVVRRFKSSFPDKPIISGGLLTEEKEIRALWEAGSVAISTTTEELWNVT